MAEYEKFEGFTGPMISVKANLAEVNDVGVLKTEMGDFLCTSYKVESIPAMLNRALTQETP